MGYVYFVDNLWIICIYCELNMNKLWTKNVLYRTNIRLMHLSLHYPRHVKAMSRTAWERSYCKAFSYLKRLQNWPIHNQKYHNTILLWHDRGYVYITNHINRERIFWMYSTYRLPSKIQIISTKISPITILSPHRIQLLL